jgi:hypothetical protein
VKRFVSVILNLSLATVLLAHCGGAPEPEQVVQRVVERENVVVTAEVEKEVTVVENVEVEAEVAPQEAPEASEQLAAASGPALAPRPRAERMIIKNAEMELLVSDTDAALDSITVIASDYGGYIISSHSWYKDDFKYATIRIGVPVEEFENVLHRLRGLALRVINEIASGEDVTDQFVDLQSRLTNLQATRDRIREFLDKAENVEEALQVNEQLSEVEGQIEEIQGRMNYLKDRAAYSTIDVQLNPEIPTPTVSPTPTVTPTATPTPTPTPEAWRPGETVQAATDVLSSVTKGLVDVVIWVLIVLGPFLLVVALFIGLVVWLWRRRARPAPPGEPAEPAES